MAPQPPLPSATVRLAFPPEARLLATVRLVLGLLARKAGLDDEGVEDLKVAVSEACTVLMEDAAQAGQAAPIELEVAEGEKGLQVEVRHRAPAPAPLAWEQGGASDRQLGLALVAALVEDLRSEPLEGGSGTRFSFFLPRRRPLTEA